MALCLGLKSGDRIHIDMGGERMTLLVHENRHGRMKIVFEGPQSFCVLRDGLDGRPGESQPRVKPLLRAEREPEQPVRKRRSRFGMGGEE